MLGATLLVAAIGFAVDVETTGPALLSISAILFVASFISNQFASARRQGFEEKIAEVRDLFKAVAAGTPEAQGPDDPVAVATRCIEDRLGRDIRIVHWEPRPRIDESTDRIIVWGQCVEDNGLNGSARGS